MLIYTTLVVLSQGTFTRPRYVAGISFSKEQNKASDKEMIEFDKTQIYNVTPVLGDNGMAK